MIYSQSNALFYFYDTQEGSESYGCAGAVTGWFIYTALHVATCRQTLGAGVVLRQRVATVNPGKRYCSSEIAVQVEM